MAERAVGEPAVVATPETERESKNEVRHAPRYRVLIHNDNVTTMEFVVHVLRKIFQKPEEEALEIMFRAHHAGLAHVVTLPLEQAEFRVDQTHSLARTQKFPLKLTYERED